MSIQNIDLIPVDSTQIHAIGHDAATNTLAIQFMSKGKPGNVYEYANVPAKKFEAMLAAESIGKFFGAEIKAKVDDHPFTKIEPVKAEESEAPE